ncbi:MAG: hypothetical protein ABI051_18750 [Vicinamibacterales bacterium]
MSILRGVALVLFAFGPAMGGASQEVAAWGDAVQGVQLRLAISDGPLPVSAELLPLEVQLRNRGMGPVTFIGEAIIHPEIEIDGVWYAQVWAGSCCAAPREILPGGKGEVVSFRVLPGQVFAVGAKPARTLDLKPGKHSVRIRNVLQDRIDVRLGSSPLVLMSNAVTIDIPASVSNTSRQSVTPVACGGEPGRRFDRVHGAVERGERFNATTGAGWMLRLEPLEHGWALQVSTTDRPAEDLSRLTPPWQFVPNPREIEGWHFRNAINTGPNDGSVNAPGPLREFIFSPLVGREIEYAGSATTAADVERVRSFGRGWLFTESYRLSPVGSGGRADIEALTFWACLTWPAG